MSKHLLSLFLFAAILPLGAQDLNPAYLDYIARYREIAVSQQIEFGIPASITMAQALLESGAGLSELATEANNHFGIKCSSNWNGPTFNHDDDRLQECFRKYESPEQSFADHSRFLLRQRYQSLFSIPVEDYGEWARGLSRCGYATDPQYPDKLIKIIQDYRLDQLASSPLPDADILPATVAPEIQEEDTVDDFFAASRMEAVSIYHEHRSGHMRLNRYILADEGETFTSLAYYLNMRESTLRRYNDATDGRVLQANDRVYLYPKPKRAQRKYASYYVRTGDSAWSIAQKFCFRMRTIYDLNGIPYGTPLVTRQILRLR
ncbi:MAG: glucosaminidase domain-containing protein [Paludibacteraceae bacterium]|nr:glucosaminidase domain-containing protein [Paludibacteraceae bacterium]